MSDSHADSLAALPLFDPPRPVWDRRPPNCCVISAGCVQVPVMCVALPATGRAREAVKRLRLKGHWFISPCEVAHRCLGCLWILDGHRRLSSRDLSRCARQAGLDGLLASRQDRRRRENAGLRRQTLPCADQPPYGLTLALRAARRRRRRGLYPAPPLVCHELKGSGVPESSYLRHRSCSPLH